MTAADQFARYYLGAALARIAIRAGLLIALLAAMLIPARCALNEAVRAAELFGAQSVRDSLAAVTLVKLHRTADSAKVVARAAGVRIEQQATTLTRRIDRLAQLTVPPISITPSGDTARPDSVRIADEPTVYAIPPRIVQWMVDANAKIVKQDSVLADARALADSIPPLIAHYDAALSALDSVATAERAIRIRTQRERDAAIAQAKGSKWKTAGEWTIRIALAVTAYQLGTHR